LRVALLLLLLVCGEEGPRTEKIRILITIDTLLMVLMMAMESQQSVVFHHASSPFFKADTMQVVGGWEVTLSDGASN